MLQQQIESQMLHICHMAKLLNMHLWEKYAYIYIYAIYETAPIKDADKITVQR